MTREAIMARLVVEAKGTAATGAAQGAGDVDLATPGNSRRLPLVVSVTDADGVAVTGLTAANFTVDAKLVGPGGATVEIEPRTVSAVAPTASTSWTSYQRAFRAPSTRGWSGVTSSQSR
jgi:hypothetical protein